MKEIVKNIVLLVLELSMYVVGMALLLYFLAGKVGV